MGLTYTFLQLKNAAAHALGGNPDSRISKGLIVNRAINHLVNAHPWPWLVKLANLSFTADQNYITLPADFGEVIQIQGNAARFSTIRPLQPEDFLHQRSFGVADTLYLGYYVQIAEPASATAAPLYQMQIAPTPSATLADALYLMYRKQIDTFITDDSLTTDDTKIPAIPSGMHDTLYQLVRAYAVSMEENPQTTEWALALQMLQRDIMKAAAVEPAVMGPMRNCGVAEWHGPAFAVRPHDRIDTSDLIGS
jgi:hypothetical protein